MGTQEGEEGERDQEGRKEDEVRRESEEEGDKQVKKDVTDWVEVRRRTRRKRCKMVQIFVKVNGSKATPIEVNLTDDTVEDVMKRIQSDDDAYVTMQGKVLKISEKLKSCGVTDGCTIQVTSRMRGGGKHKDKKSKGEKKQVAQLDDGMCAMACEQMRWITESISTFESTEEEKRRLAEEVDKVRKMMAGVEKQVTGEDLQRLSDMEEGLKTFEEEVQAKGVDDQEVMTNFEDKCEKKVMREGRGRAGLVQGGDETHRMNETCGKSKGKGNGGKGEHGGKGDNGGKGFQQSAKMLKGEEEQEADEEDERVQVAPYMGAGGSYPQAMTDPEEEAAEGKHGTRKMRWVDCDDKEEEEGWKRKVTWLDGSDEEQDGQEEAAGERGEMYEVWKEKVSGREEVWSEVNEEPEERRERERGARGRGEEGAGGARGRGEESAGGARGARKRSECSRGARETGERGES